MEGCGHFNQKKSLINTIFKTHTLLSYPHTHTHNLVTHLHNHWYNVLISVDFPQFNFWLNTISKREFLVIIFFLGGIKIKTDHKRLIIFSVHFVPSPSLTQTIFNFPQICFPSFYIFSVPLFSFFLSFFLGFFLSLNKNIQFNLNT